MNSFHSGISSFAAEGDFGNKKQADTNVGLLMRA